MTHSNDLALDLINRGTVVGIKEMLKPVAQDVHILYTEYVIRVRVKTQRELDDTLE